MADTAVTVLHHNVKTAALERRCADAPSAARRGEHAHKPDVRIWPEWTTILGYSFDMELDPDTCYQSLLSRDRRFDGWFFVAVSSTRIYCRVVCPVRAPKRENCAFYASAAAAEKAGYRPCLRCRPELAPGNGVMDASGTLAQAAAGLIVDGFLNSHSLSALAARVGVTERHLRRIFAAEYGVSMIEFVQTQRLLLAKRLLTDTALPVTTIAFMAGFGSVRRFNDLFVSRYGLNPLRLRKRGRSDASGHPASQRLSEGGGLRLEAIGLAKTETSAQAAPAAEDNQESLRFELAYRPPFCWQGALAFLAHRQIAGVECVDWQADGQHGVYTRAIEMPASPHPVTGWFSVRHLPQHHTVEVTLAASLAPVVGTLLRRIAALFDLNCQPDRIDEALGPLAADMPGMRVPGAVDGFEIAARAIVGQQVSVARARVILSRIAAAYGTRIARRIEPNLAFPSAATLSQVPVVALIGAGLIRMRAEALVALAIEVAAGRIDLVPSAPLIPTLEALRQIRGVGEWTVQYIAMRALGWPNAFPSGDAVVKKQLGLTCASAVNAHAAQWAPWRAYATLHLWRRALETSS